MNPMNYALIEASKLKQRFLSAIDAFQMDARAQNIPKYVDNFHTVERDFLLSEESEIELPEWLKNA